MIILFEISINQQFLYSYTRDIVICANTFFYIRNTLLKLAMRWQLTHLAILYTRPGIHKV